MQVDSNKVCVKISRFPSKVPNCLRKVCNHLVHDNLGQILMYLNVTSVRQIGYKQRNFSQACDLKRTGEMQLHGIFKQSPKGARRWGPNASPEAEDIANPSLARSIISSSPSKKSHLTTPALSTAQECDDHARELDTAARELAVIVLTPAWVAK